LPSSHRRVTALPTASSRQELSRPLHTNSRPPPMNSRRRCFLAVFFVAIVFMAWIIIIQFQAMDEGFYISLLRGSKVPSLAIGNALEVQGPDRQNTPILAKQEFTAAPKPREKNPVEKPLQEVQPSRSGISNLLQDAKSCNVQPLNCTTSTAESTYFHKGSKECGLMMS